MGPFRRHAIESIELEKWECSEIKAALLEQIGREIEKKKSLGMGIYNIGRRA